MILDIYLDLARRSRQMTECRAFVTIQVAVVAVVATADAAAAAGDEGMVVATAIYV